MRRFLAAMVAVFGCAQPCGAQQTTIKSETLISLSVSPAAAPRPAFKYLLLPELREMNPGNPIQGYMKCLLDQYPFVFDQQGFDRRKPLLAMPFDELTLSEAPGLGSLALKQADAAARLDNPDWQILLKIKVDGFETLIPDVQTMRNVARALNSRFHAEIAGGRLDEAIETAKTMFAMARHLGEHPTLIGELVGIAVASIAITPLEEMMAHPDCPNLYWAFTNLPDPFISARTALEGERITIWGLGQDLDSTAPMSASALKKFIDNLDRLIGNDLAGKEPGGVRGYIARLAKDEQKLAGARKRLTDSGIKESAVKTFPPEQIILLDEMRELRARFDDVAKLMVFPAWQFEEMAEKAKGEKREPALIADLLLPAQAAVRQAQARLAQRLALLRTIEAIRLYAAEHKGALPEKLKEISVPLPDDTFTGKPFRYELAGATAHLRGTPPKSAEHNPFLRVHYEIRVRN
jgi:hypothetical protein